MSIASFEEGYAKAKIIRGRGLYVPIYYVLAPQKKSLIYPPNKHVVLLEDKIQNAEDWEDNGGKAILINCKTTQKNRTYIKNFSDLLKK